MASDLLESIYGSLVGGAIYPDWNATLEAGNRNFFDEVEGHPDADFRAAPDFVLIPDSTEHNERIQV